MNFDNVKKKSDKKRIGCMNIEFGDEIYKKMTFACNVLECSKQSFVREAVRAGLEEFEKMHREGLLND